MPGIRALLPASCLLLVGCLEVEQTVTLNADGSGTQIVHLTVREQLLVELQRRQPAARLGERGDASAVFDEAKVGRELADAGLELTKHAVVRSDGLRTVDLSASFADFATLQKSPLSGSAAEWELGPGPKDGLAKLTFYPQGKAAWQTARERAAKMADREDPVAMRFFEKQKQQLAGLDVAIRLRLPGKVYLWTRNMRKAGEREVEATVKAAEIRTPEDLVRRLAPRFQVVFDAAGTTLLER